MKATQKLKNLTTSQALDLLASLGKGNGEHQENDGGGISPADLADIQPDGKTGKLVDKLEQRVYFLLVREVRVAVLKALPGAIRSLGGLSEAPMSEGEALERVPLQGIVEALGPTSHIDLLVKQTRDALVIELGKLLPSADLMKQKREAATALFDLADKLGVFTLARAYKERDEGEDLEARIRARERELRMDDEEDE